MKIGYKGLDKNMSATLGGARETFVIGEVYTKNDDLKKPRIGSSDGYHYCNTLQQVFSYYPYDGKNRYFKIEVLGNFTDSSEKSTTTSFRLLEEIDQDIVEKIHLDEHFNINLLKEIQIKYPMLHIGGSVGLYLHGVRLKRWFGKNQSKSDFDMVSPYFILPEGEIDEEEITYLNAKASANDFDETFLVGRHKVDYRIDPKQRYEIIEHNGFKFKVSNLLTILEAKMRYALQPAGKKHKDDIIEMVVRVPKKKNNEKLDLLNLFK